MDLEARKISFVQEFLRLQNEDIIGKLEKLLHKKAELIEQDLKPMSMKQFNDEIDQSLNDSKNGRLIKATDLKAKVQKMELIVYWTQLSEDKLDDIFQYYKIKANKKTALKLINGIIDTTIDLEKNPEIGQIENLLKDKEQEFRYLVYRNYKIIYWINKPFLRIEILNVFDSRQNPEKINEIE